jgi:hypothetical protein
MAATKKNSVEFDMVIDHRNEDKNKNIKVDSVEAFIVKVDHAEIRKVRRVQEIFNSDNGDIISNYIELICEDGSDDCNRFTVKDRNIQNEYKAGQIGTFILQIYIEHKFRGKTSVNLVSFEPSKE